MPYVSTLEKRRLGEIVTMDDFNCAGSIDFPYLSADEDKAAFVSCWNERIPYHPRELSKIFSSVVGEHKFTLSVSLTRGDFGIVALRNDGGGQPSFQQQDYDFSFSTPAVLNSQVALDRRFQDQGLGQNLSRAFLDLDIALGVKEIKFLAELQVGGYAWAKMGYYLDRSGFVRINDTRRLSQNLLEKLMVLKDLIPIEDYNRAKTYCSLANKDDIYYVAQLNCEVQIDDRLEKIAQEHYTMLPMIRFYKEKQKPVTLGKLLLMGEGWHAMADYTDKVQMDRITSYTGALKHSVWQDDVTSPPPVKDVRRARPSLAAV